MQKDLPKRKSIRLPGYDYSQPGYYFVTFCVESKRKLLGRVVGSGFHPRPSVELTKIGIEVQKSIQHVGSGFHPRPNNAGIEIQKYVIMPNHIHMIVVLTAVGDGTPTLQSVVGRIKSYTTKRWNDINNTKYETLWQSGFHDHIIRSEAGYQRIWQYIDENPARWVDDRYFIEEL